MRALTRPGPGIARRAARGAAFLWVILVGMPVMFLGTSMAVDLTRVVLASRQVTAIADAAAVGGAFQFVPGKPALDQARASQVAKETVCHGSTNRAIRQAALRGGCQSATAVTTTSTKVTVTVRYDVDGLLLLSLFGAEDFKNVSVTRTAMICIPQDTTGPTGGFCARPRL